MSNSELGYRITLCDFCNCVQISSFLSFRAFHTLQARQMAWWEEEAIFDWCIHITYVYIYMQIYTKLFTSYIIHNLCLYVCKYWTYFYSLKIIYIIWIINIYVCISTNIIVKVLSHEESIIKWLWLSTCWDFTYIILNVSQKHLQRFFPS
jgi:hypothetical protein